MPDDSVTIMLQPEDDTETILEKVRRAGAKKVSLIVPPGTRSLQTLGGFTMLRKACDITGMEVTVYSTDEKTADMAKVCRFEVVRLDQETRPREVPPPEEELPRIVVSPRPPEPAPAVAPAEAAPVVEEARGELEERLGGLSADDLALFDALETMSLSEDVELRPEALRRPAAALAEPPAVRAPEPRRERPARETPTRKKPSFLRNILDPLSSALSNIISAVLGAFVGLAARVAQRKAAPAAAEAPAAVAPRIRTDDESRMLRSRKLRYYLWAGIGVVGFTLLLILFYALSQPAVIVALTPKEAETQEMDLALTIVMTDTVQPGSKATIEGNQVALQAKPVQVELSGQASGQASGRAIIADSTATGAVVLTNPYCEWDVPVPAGTRVATAGGISFVTMQDTVVPALVKVGSVARVGIAPVGISAEVPGSAGNVGIGQINTIADPSGGCLLVINEVPTSGGSEHEGTIVTAADQDGLRSQLIAGLTDQALADLEKQVGSLEVFSGSLEIVVVQEQFSHQVGEETTTLLLTATVRAQALAGTPQALEAAVRMAAEQKLGGAKAGRKMGDVTHGKLEAGQPGINANVWTYHTKARVPLLTVIDDTLKSEIAGALNGKTPSEAKQIMEKYRDRIASFSISPVVGVLGSVQVVDASLVKK